FTSALASASSPATVNASVVFSALLTRWSLTVTARLPPTSAVGSSVWQWPAPAAVLPAVSIVRTDTVSDGPRGGDRSTLPVSLPPTCTVTVLVPSLYFTSALASASSPATVNASVVFSALLTRWSLTVTARLPPTSAVWSSV